MASVVAAGQLAADEFDTWFRVRRAELGLPAHAAPSMPSAPMSGRTPPLSPVPNSHARATDASPNEDEKARWWRQRVATPVPPFRPLYHHVRDVSTEARRAVLNAKGESVLGHWEAVLTNVGPDRLECQRRFLYHLLMDNYRSAVRDERPMPDREWESVSALLAGGLAIEVVLIAKHHEDRLDRVYGPEVALPGPPMGRDLLRKHLETTGRL